MERCCLERKGEGKGEEVVAAYWDLSEETEFVNSQVSLPQPTSQNIYAVYVSRRGCGRT